MRKIYLLIFISITFTLNAQVQLGGSGLISIDFNQYRGNGFVQSPDTSQIDSDSFRVDELSDSTGYFGMNVTTGDFARGSSSGGIGTGGCYSFEVGSGDYIFGIQPGGSDMTPGSVTLKIQNNTGDILTRLNFSFDLYSYNDQNRSSIISFQFSPDDTTYTLLSVYDYETSLDKDDEPIWEMVNRTGSITTLSIPDGEFVYISWLTDDNGGTGSRDEIGIDNIVLSSGDNPLPVELTSFAASTNHNSVILNWQTRTERDNYGFEIERRTSTPLSVTGGMINGDKNVILSGDEGWQTIEFIKGSGTSNIINTYQYVDENLSDSKLYYRLKQIDTDGSYSYSKIVEVNLNTVYNYKLDQNYPNPFNPATTIEYSLPNKSHIKLIIYNSIGEEVRTLVNKFQNEGTHKIKFNAEDLSSGIYFYKIYADNFIQTKKMILLK